MIVAIQQPEHLPWIGFFNKMTRCDLFIYLDNVQFKKRYFENRNRILSSSGPIWLTVPVFSKGRYHQCIDEVKICYDSDWQGRYVRSLQHCYSTTPFFDVYFEDLSNILNTKFSLLVDLNLALIEYLRGKCGITTDVVRASEMGNIQEKGSDLILELCKRTGAVTYISGPDGRNYLDSDAFDIAEVNITYHDYEHPIYMQQAGEFVSQMSVVDFLFNNDKTGIIIG